MSSHLAPAAVGALWLWLPSLLGIIASGALAGCQCPGAHTILCAWWRWGSYHRYVEGGARRGTLSPSWVKGGDRVFLPSTGGSRDDRGSRLLCRVYTWAGGCETARRKREVRASYLPRFALNVKMLKVWVTTRESAVKNVATDRGEDSWVRWADCACLCVKASLMGDADRGLLWKQGGLQPRRGFGVVGARWLRGDVVVVGGSLAGGGMGGSHLGVGGHSTPTWQIEEELSPPYFWTTVSGTVY